VLKNPIAILSIQQRRSAFFILAFLNIIIIVVMQVMGQSLKPHGIIPFEFAGSVENAQTMIQDWAERDVLKVLFFLLGFDYLFMITYSVFLWLACLQAAERSVKFSSALIVLAWLQPLAGFLDATENFALYQMAFGSMKNIWPLLAYSCAVPKFMITGLGLLSWISFGVVSRKKT
jgi:hypothetical protein